ncbi:MAG TPA: hypothetical protein VMF11_01265 [Candidatus Baltobacteraceae bacterium]|nr:hypothetical protein [Candidatus Baltobacteraceae bacterium]
MRARRIELTLPVAMAPPAARESLARVMQALAKAGTSPDRFALAVQLTDLHAGVAGEVRIPAELRVAERPVHWEYGLSIHAASGERIFPAFEGALSLTPVGNAAELWLQGFYTPPFGIIGALLDRTVFRNVARRSLDSFLKGIAGEIAADAKEHYSLRIL